MWELELLKVEQQSLKSLQHKAEGGGTLYSSSSLLFRKERKEVWRTYGMDPTQKPNLAYIGLISYST